MSLLPYSKYDLHDPFYRLWDPDFDLWKDDLWKTDLWKSDWKTDLWKDDFWRRPLSLHSSPFYSSFYSPSRNLLSKTDNVSTLSVTNTNDQFKVNLDVQHFQPGEITVKVVDDYVLVEGKHWEKNGTSYVNRQFSRRYKLPANVNVDAVSSNLSSDGILSIVAPKKKSLWERYNEWRVPISKTNRPALKWTS